jgi:hypothetical protein
VIDNAKKKILLEGRSTMMADSKEKSELLHFMEYAVQCDARHRLHFWDKKNQH